MYYKIIDVVVGADLDDWNWIILQLRGLNSFGFGTNKLLNEIGLGSEIS